MMPLVVLLPAQILVSGYWVVRAWSADSFICCGFMGGTCVPLLMASEAVPAGSVRVIVGSFLDATQPAGTLTDTAEVDWVPPPAGVGEGCETGLGVVAGVGLGRSEPT